MSKEDWDRKRAEHIAALRALDQPALETVKRYMSGRLRDGQVFEALRDAYMKEPMLSAADAVDVVTGARDAA